MLHLRRCEQDKETSTCTELDDKNASCTDATGVQSSAHHRRTTTQARDLSQPVRRLSIDRPSRGLLTVLIETFVNITTPL